MTNSHNPKKKPTTKKAPAKKAPAKKVVPSTAKPTTSTPVVVELKAATLVVKRSKKKSFLARLFTWK